MANGDAKGRGAVQQKVKCPKCPPKGLPGWMATFSDLVTLLLTFFVLLLSFAKTESAKYEAAMGSIRSAFGGNVLRPGKVIQKGKSPDDAPMMVESEEPPRPFPVEFLTREGILDKHEINRESDEDLQVMRQDLQEFDLSENVNIYELPEGIRVEVKDKVYFKVGSTIPSKIAVRVYDKLVKMLSQKNWVLTVMGHAEPGEVSKNGKQDAFELSAERASAVARSLIKRGVAPEKITTSFYGDSKTKILRERSGKKGSRYRYVEFMIRKRHVETGGHKVDSR